MPAAQRMLDDNHINADQVSASGPGGRLLKEDVAKFVTQAATTASSIAVGAGIAAVSAASVVGKAVASVTHAPTAAPTQPTQPASQSLMQSGSPNRSEEVKPMSMIRRTIATRLVQAQHNAALLTTFNEVDMQPVMQLRTKYKDAFNEKHGVKLGFMSFFAKSCLRSAATLSLRSMQKYVATTLCIAITATLALPSWRQGVGCARTTQRREDGICRHRANHRRVCDTSFSKQVNADDLEGGTFTISNGGIYGSLLSTPIVNPPQSASSVCTRFKNGQSLSTDKWLFVQ